MPQPLPTPCLNSKTGVSASPRARYFGNFLEILPKCIYLQKLSAMRYQVHITPLMRSVTKTLSDELEGVNLCVVQHARNLVVEVSRGDVSRVIMALKKHYPDVVDIKRAYPMIEDLHDYILVKPFISESPVFRQGEVTVPTIEKLLVDRISDKEYSQNSLASTVRAFQKTFEEYDVNVSRLVRYASRKGKKEEISEILSRGSSASGVVVRFLCKDGGKARQRFRFACIHR